MSAPHDVMLPPEATDVKTVVRKTFIEVDDTPPNACEDSTRRNRAMTDTALEWNTPCSKPHRVASGDCFGIGLKDGVASDGDATTQVGSPHSGSLDADMSYADLRRLSGTSGLCTPLASVPESSAFGMNPYELDVKSPRARLLSLHGFDLHQSSSAGGDTSPEALERHAESLEAQAAQLTVTIQELRTQARQARAAATAIRQKDVEDRMSESPSMIVTASRPDSPPPSVTIMNAASPKAGGASSGTGCTDPQGQSLTDRCRMSSVEAKQLLPGFLPVSSPCVPNTAPAHVVASEDTTGLGGASRDVEDVDRTTVLIRNLPNGYTRDQFVELLNEAGFCGSFNFVYFPTDFKNWNGFGYAFVNAMSHTKAAQIINHFKGYTKWNPPCNKICNVVWSGPHQGLEAHVDRYRNSPVMHQSVPDGVKPALFDEHGVRIAFPSPTKTIRAPRVRHGVAAWTQANDSGSSPVSSIGSPATIA